MIGKTAAPLGVFILALFLPAGTLVWFSAWIYVAITFAFSIGLTAWLIRYDPMLMVERLTGLRQVDQKKWDKIFIRILLVGFFAWLAVMYVRLVHLPDEQKRKELMIIYGEDLALTGSTAANLNKGGKAYDQWTSIGKSLVERAKQKITIEGAAKP